jgi:hypothetical protein
VSYAMCLVSAGGASGSGVYRSSTGDNSSPAIIPGENAAVIMITF